MEAITFVFIAVVCILYFALKRRHRPAPPATTASLPAPPAPPPPPEPAPKPPDAASERVAASLSKLSKELSPLAEEISDPSELPDLPLFQQAVAVLSRPDVTPDTLRTYALGANWPLSCAAFKVLAGHAERQSLRDPVLRQLENLRPYVLMYALIYLTTLDQRPAVGAPFLSVPDWWQNNPVIPAFFEDYLTRRAALGDKPDFSNLLAKRVAFPTGPAKALLRKLTHPSAAELLRILQAWDERQIDRAYLSTIGTIWDPADPDPLLVTPPAWQEDLSAAKRAVTQGKPRSLLVSGGPRVGKTAFLALLGAQLQSEGWTIFSAAGNELQADQMYIGQLEGRIRKLVESLHSRRKLVWHVPDLAQLARSGTHTGQSASILDQILPAITSGNLIVLGEAHPTATARLFQQRPSLRAVINAITLAPMDAPTTLQLATQIGANLARRQNLTLSPGTPAAILELTQSYLGTQQLPGAAIELLKRAAARAAHDGRNELTPATMIATLSQISGLPMEVLDTAQIVDLQKLTRFFASRVMGQDEAVGAVVDRIAMLKAGLTDPGRPIGVFLFAGSTGTGKTELAKTLAEFLFGSPDRMVRLDMSEFQSPDSTTKILGQRGEPSGESLIDRVRKQPFSVVLLDEFEKAHPNCWDLFLQIFDDGRLSDANGGEADFRHCFIILTSNLGAGARSADIGFGARATAPTADEAQVHAAIARTFRPEFVNRLDKIIVFRPLTRELMRGILHKELALVLQRRGFKERSWAVEWEASAIEFLLDRGFSAQMGARPLKRAIDQHLLAPLARTLVEHRFPEGEQFLFVRSDRKKIVVEFVDPDGATLPEAEPEPTDDEPSLATILWRPTGSSAERTALGSVWATMQAEMASPAWQQTADAPRLALADPAIWSRPDRQEIFSRLELQDRVTEAARTTERLFQRYESTGARTPAAARELAARLALQLFNLRNGMDDIAAKSPVDALLRVEPAMEPGSHANAAAWCERLTAMYTGWSAKRRAQLEEFADPNTKGAPILQIHGFAAYRTLAAEAGLHVFEEPGTDTSRRIVARVTVVAGPAESLPKGTGFAAAQALLATAGPGTAIVRRYRETPAPLVRDAVKGWRTGRLDAVPAGDFDLVPNSSS